LKIIPVDFLLEKVLKLKLKATQESGGYSSNFLESTGLLFLIFALASLFLIFGLAVRKLFKKTIVIKIIARLVYDILCFNFFLRTLIAGYLVWAISSLKALQALNFENPIDSFQSILAVITALICLFTPLLLKVLL